MPESVDSRFLVILSVFSTVICITQDNHTVIVTPIPVPSFTLSDLFITPTNTVILKKKALCMDYLCTSTYTQYRYGITAVVRFQTVMIWGHDTVIYCSSYETMIQVDPFNNSIPLGIAAISYVPPLPIPVPSFTLSELSSYFEKQRWSTDLIPLGQTKHHKFPNCDYRK
jgi:hypothetical protein